MRINKFLAQCGVASRRKCDDLIVSGKIKVNGKIVNVLGLDIDEQHDCVECDGQIVKSKEKKVYYIFNKPSGCITTSKDDRERKTVLDFFANVEHRVFPVGRLDYNTTGLLILTNDGDFANKLMHPSNHISKTYVAKIRGELTPNEIKLLSNGVVIDGFKTHKAIVKVLSKNTNTSIVEITIFEGRNRQIRKMLESVNKLVVSLKRTKIGQLEIGNVEVGQYKKVDFAIIEKALK